MKTLRIIIGLLTFFSSLYMEVGAQSITLSFTGVKYGLFVPLDSVLIENLYVGCDTTIYYPDTILTIHTLGLGEPSTDHSKFTVFQNVPNPSGSGTAIKLFQPATGAVSVVVSDMQGHQVASFSGELDRGYHRFDFMPGGSDFYLFSAISSGIVRTIKIVSLLNTGGQSCLLNYAGMIKEEAKVKQAIPAGGFTYTPGDRLRFTGFSNAFTKTFEDAPQGNVTYTFYFFDPGIPCPGIPIVIHGGQTYNTLLIGNRCWLRESLNIGTMIICKQNQTDNGVIEKYCRGDWEYNCEIEGGLYQWDEMMQYVTTSGARGICPDGWQIPTEWDWEALANNLGGRAAAGGRMKETGTSHWKSPNTGATNSSGFTALPAGIRDSGGLYFAYYGSHAFFWTSTLYASPWRLDYNNGYFSPPAWPDDRKFGYSVRCMKYL